MQPGMDNIDYMMMKQFTKSCSHFLNYVLVYLAIASYVHVAVASRVRCCLEVSLSLLLLLVLLPQVHHISLPAVQLRIFSHWK